MREEGKGKDKSGSEVKYCEDESQTAGILLVGARNSAVRLKREQRNSHDARSGRSLSLLRFASISGSVLARYAEHERASLTVIGKH